MSEERCPRTDRELAALPQRPDRTLAPSAVNSLLLCGLSALDPAGDKLLRPTDPQFAFAMAALTRPTQIRPACADASVVGVAQRFVFATTAKAAYRVWAPSDPCGRPLGVLP